MLRPELRHGQPPFDPNGYKTRVPRACADRATRIHYYQPPFARSSFSSLQDFYLQTLAIKTAHARKTLSSEYRPQQAQDSHDKRSNRWGLLRKPLVLQGAAILLLLSATLATACSAKQPTEITPTHSPAVVLPPEPTATPWPAGGLNPSICDSGEAIIQKDGTTPVPPPSEPDIIAFNKCMKEQLAADQAAATAEAQETAKRIVEQIGRPTGYRPATKEENDYFAPQDGKPPFIDRPAVQTDAKGILLIPVYPPETILGKAPSIAYLRSILSEDAWLGTEQEIQRWITLLENNRDLLDCNTGEEAEVKKNLESLKSRIEFISESDGPKGYNYNLDKNKDGISDYTEEMHKGIITVLETLLKL